MRTAAEWDAVVASNPFPDEAASDPGHLVVMALKAAPDAAAVAALQASVAGRETVRAVGRQAYLVYPDGIGESKLTIKLIEKHLGTRGTGRNWNTTLTGPRPGVSVRGLPAAAAPAAAGRPRGR